MLERRGSIPEEARRGPRVQLKQAEDKRDLEACPNV